MPEIHHIIEMFYMLFLQKQIHYIVLHSLFCIDIQISNRTVQRLGTKLGTLARL